jgi:hypothetical protein|tara:strand:+ start:942 stop:1067 length:126 start_codon:yes stop_codon:yes gene_type:complete
MQPKQQQPVWPLNGSSSLFMPDENLAQWAKDRFIDADAFDG